MLEILRQLLPLLLVGGLIVSALFFILPGLSPIPFYPTHKKDLDKITRLILAEEPTHILDIGAGTGRVVFSVLSEAKRRSLKPVFIAVEINPLLVLILHLRRLLHAQWKKVHVVWGNAFNMNLISLFKWGSYHRAQGHNRHFAVYLYGSSTTMSQLSRKFRELPPGTIIVSYIHPIPAWEGKRIHEEKGENEIFVYRR